MSPIVPIGLLALLMLVPSGHGAKPEASLDLSWRAPIAGRADAVVADAGGAVAVADRGEVTAFDVRGEMQWSVDVAAEGESTYFVTPSLGSDVVAVPVDDMRVVVLERDTGSVRWTADLPGVSRTAIGEAADGTKLVVAANDSGRLTAYDAVTGGSIWSNVLAPVDPENSAPQLWFGAGRVVVQWLTDGDIVRFTVFDGRSGTVAWDKTLVGISTVASVTERAVSFAELYAVDGKKMSVAVRSLDVESGLEIWDHELVTESPFFPAFVGAAARGIVAVVDLDGTIRAFDADDGRLRWKVAPNRKQYEAQLQISGGVLTMSTYGSGLVAVSTRDGEPVRSEGIGPTQLAVTIEATASAGRRLYLLVTRNGEDVDENGEVWSLRASR